MEVVFFLLTAITTSIFHQQHKRIALLYNYHIRISTLPRLVHENQKRIDTRFHIDLRSALRDISADKELINMKTSLAYISKYL